MPSFEILLRFPDGHEELRLTDIPVAIGQTLTIMGKDWVVVSDRKPSDPRFTARFVCERPPRRPKRRQVGREAGASVPE